MSYKVYLWGALTPVEWSQAVWKKDGRLVSIEEAEDELLHSVLTRYLPKDGITVDAGCGTARWPMYFQRLGYRILGIEISRDGCVIAKENDPTVDVLQADVKQVPLKDHSVDAVMSLGVVEHDEAGPLDALRESHRILKRNGLLILAVPYNNLFRRLIVNPLQAYVNAQRRRVNAPLCFGEYRFSKREVRGFLKRAGFEVVAAYPNDTQPPRTVGLWVDYDNLTYNPLRPPPTELFVFPGNLGKIASGVLRWAPWLVCAEVAFVARAA